MGFCSFQKHFFEKPIFELRLGDFTVKKMREGKSVFNWKSIK